jgi:hypothetical protein
MGAKRCISSCKEFPKEECNPPRCAYINGNTRKYCRLSSKYIMNKPKCNITRRIKKKDKEIYAKKHIGDFLKRTGKILQLVCARSGECLSFGKKVDEITALFKGFAGFEYAISPIRPLGKPSSNGFVKEIEYERNGYKAYAALKSSLDKSSDNLLYEYLVGVKFINRVIKRFPCFLQTYGFYFYKTDNDRITIKHMAPLDKNVLQKLDLQNSINYNKACNDSILAGVLIQHIRSAKSMRDMIKSYSKFCKTDAIYMLFIIYQALASLKRQFTHYDLHDENVLIIQPDPSKYYIYHYHLSDGTSIEFKSTYIPKIIDYGRCFFDNGNTNSKKIYQKVCNTCKMCGEDSGFQWFELPPSYGISSQKKNESHDLRLLHMIKIQLNKDKTSSIPQPNTLPFIELETMLNKVIYGVGISTRSDKLYGTNENLTIHPNRSKITNVTNAYEYLKYVIKKPDIMKYNNDLFNGITLDGTFHIYDDGKPMEYI